MSLPDFQSIMLPLLTILSDGQVYQMKDLTKTLADKFALTDEEREQLLPSGKQTVFSNRVAWAKANLKRAGLVEHPTRGVARITDSGRNVLARNPPKIDLAFLREFIDGNGPGPGPGPEGETPEERLEAAYLAIREALANELLDRVKTCSPQFFERLVVQLLVAMGYGGSLADAGKAVGRAGDGGIDGIIKEDKLGLGIVCIQAKRWENTVGRPDVQRFAGSMEAHRAKKGVMITTSTFSADAKDYVKRIERKIVLIDGEKLAEYMIDHNVGVSVVHAYVHRKVDLDFFVEE